MGSNKEDQKGLFKLFGMISDKNDLNPNGWGIGLTVSKKYIEHLRGHIQFESDFGIGTRVEFLIPTCYDLSDLRNHFKKCSFSSFEENFDLLDFEEYEEESDIFTRNTYAFKSRLFTK